MHRKFLLIVLVFLLVLFPQVAGKIENPENVNYLHAEITKTGYIYLQPQSPIATARDLNVMVSVPQNTSRQFIVLKKIEGPDRYEMDKDEWNNQVLNLYWKNPVLEQNLEYKLVFDVIVSNTYSGSVNKFPITDLIKASPEITEKVHELITGLDGVHKFFRLTEWVYNHIEYDLAYEGVTKSATWVFNHRKGVCDEFSSLLISMLRVLGYNAYYVAGYAYSNDWGPHGWVEVIYNGKTITLDPTWLESPVDATHIKFAVLPDSNFTEHAEIKGRDVDIIWEKHEPSIRLIEKKEKPRVDIKTYLIPERVGDNSYSLLLTQVSGTNCLLGKIQVQSCSKDGEPFLSLLSGSNQTLGFCYNDTIVWFLKSPELKKGVIYTCPLSIYAAGNTEMVSLSIVSGLKEDINLYMDVPKILTPKQEFVVTSNIENSGWSKQNLTLYLIFNQHIQTRQIELDSKGFETINWHLNAPSNKGDVQLILFVSSGDLIEQNLSIITTKMLRLKHISIPKEIKIGESGLINITIKCLKDIDQGRIQVKVNNRFYEKVFALKKDETKTIQFTYKPETQGNKVINIVLLSDGYYEDSWFGNLWVKKEKTWVEGIIEWFNRFIEYILLFFRL